MDEFAVDPQRGAGVGEMLPLEKAGADRGAGDALVETRQGDTGAKRRLHQAADWQSRDFVRH